MLIFHLLATNEEMCINIWNINYLNYYWKFGSYNSNCCSRTFYPLVGDFINLVAQYEG